MWTWRNTSRVWRRRSAQTPMRRRLAASTCARARGRNCAARCFARATRPPRWKRRLTRLAESGLIDDRRYAERAVEVSAAGAMGVYAVRRQIARQGRGRGGRGGGAFRAGRRAAGAGGGKGGASAFAQVRFPARRGRAARSFRRRWRRRGFSWDAVRAAVDAVWEADEWDD